MQKYKRYNRTNKLVKNNANAKLLVLNNSKKYISKYIKERKKVEQITLSLNGFGKPNAINVQAPKPMVIVSEKVKRQSTRRIVVASATFSFVKKLISNGATKNKTTLNESPNKALKHKYLVINSLFLVREM